MREESRLAAIQFFDTMRPKLFKRKRKVDDADGSWIGPKPRRPETVNSDKRLKEGLRAYSEWYVQANGVQPSHEDMRAELLRLLKPGAIGRPASHTYRQVYEDNHGPIPEGHHVHHVDHDPYNDDPENLVALSPSDHARLHIKAPPG